ncbi:MAG TPA: class I SAM-dependent methyltransferase [Chthoniobacterales bacterium]
MQGNQHGPEGLFDQLGWWYALCRERLLHDDTESIIQILVSFGLALNGACLLELGCGPGFYATRIAKHFRLLNVIGVDRSAKLVEHARARSRLLRLNNCQFFKGDVYALPCPTADAGAVIASRLFMILEDREAVMAEVYRVLAPGGLLFIAEPLSQQRAMIPLRIMRGLAVLMRPRRRADAGDYCEDVQVRVMKPVEFAGLLRTLPWRRIVSWQTKHYQYAVCAKSDRLNPTQPGEPSRSRGSRGF